MPALFFVNPATLKLEEEKTMSTKRYLSIGLSALLILGGNSMAFARGGLGGGGGGAAGSRDASPMGLEERTEKKGVEGKEEGKHLGPDKSAIEKSKPKKKRAKSVKRATPATPAVPTPGVPGAQPAVPATPAK